MFQKINKYVECLSFDTSVHGDHSSSSWLKVNEWACPEQRRGIEPSGRAGLILLALMFLLISTNFTFAKANILRRCKNSIRQKFNLKAVNCKFSCTFSKFLDQWDLKNKDGSFKKTYVWQVTSNKPFTELILSWNAFRPKNKGKFSFFVSIRHNYWSAWYKLAEWGSNGQQTFVNTKNPFVHCKHVRVELARRRKATAFRIKVIARNSADLKDLKSLFVCLSDLGKFCVNKPNLKLSSIRIRGIYAQSQMNLKHPRHRDLCSPTSLGMLLKYFSGYKKSTQHLRDYIPVFAEKVHDDSYLDIYGNWILNVAQAYDSSKGNVFFRVQRLNGFNDLYYFLTKKTPVAVSVRGYLKGGKKPYDNGHFIVVVGWDQKKQSLLCIDPAFSPNKKTLRAYKIDSFLQAWGTSRNLSYVALPKNTIFKKSRIEESKTKKKKIVTNKPKKKFRLNIAVNVEDDILESVLPEPVPEPAFYSGLCVVNQGIAYQTISSKQDKQLSYLQIKKAFF